MQNSRLIAILAVLIPISSCTILPTHREKAPEIRAARPEARSGDRFPNWPHPPDSIDLLFQGSVMPMGTVTEKLGGTTGALKTEMYFPDLDKTIAFKWKTMVPPRWVDFLPFAPGALDGVNNSPRKEIAAFEIQSLFLDEEDYVVPTSLVHCAPLTHYQELFPQAKATLEGSDCVLGLLSVWLDDLTIPDPLLDNERFKRDPAYAYYLANFNLLTYLIKHHDGRRGNFLISKDEQRPQLFTIDNGVAFGGPWYNWFVANWNDIRVPALRKESIDRLRTLTEEDLHRELAVGAELRLDDDGRYRLVEDGPVLDDDHGIRIEGKALQLGLTKDEIEDIWERIEELIEDVDDGELPVI